MVYDRESRATSCQTNPWHGGKEDYDSKSKNCCPEAPGDAGRSLYRLILRFNVPLLKHPGSTAASLPLFTTSMKKKYLVASFALILLLAAILVFALRDDEPVSPSRFVEPDKLFETLQANIRNQPGFEVIVDIDHARLAAEVGSPMPPSHVLIWSDPELEAAILNHNPLAAIDLPLRVLAFEDQKTGKAAVIANSYDFVAQRYSLPDDAIVRERYENALAKATKGIPETVIAKFPSDTMTDLGLITLDSPHDFATTEKLILETIHAQADTVSFGVVDFTARSREHGVALEPLRLILFGAPGPGGKAMASAPTLGLDAFCQKFLIWQDEGGSVHVSFNDLLALAKRQNVSGGLPLRVINHRLKKTFSTALE